MTFSAGRRGATVAGFAGLLGLAPTAAPPVPEAAQPARPVARVGAALESPSLFEDAPQEPGADDPAIWVHPTRPANSLVIVTLKDAGLAVYDLAGRQVQVLAAGAGGRFNNVDLLYREPLGDRRVDLAVVTDRGRDRLRVFRIDPRWSSDSVPLRDVTSPAAPRVFPAEDLAAQASAYGLATWRERRSGRGYAFVSQNARTSMAKLRLQATRGTVTYRVVKTIELPDRFRLPNGNVWRPCDDPGAEPQVEGMVVDQDRGVLFAGQETVGIWRVDTGLRRAPRLVDRVRGYGVPARFDPASEECVSGPDPGFGGRHLTADVEGLTIYYGRGSRGYLLVSSQGNNTFAVYRRSGQQRFVGTFEIVDRPGVDGVQDSDGADVVNVPLGRRFPRGLLVVQDGENVDRVHDPGAARDNTNVKYVSWDAVADAFHPDLIRDRAGRSPRTR